MGWIWRLLRERINCRNGCTDPTMLDLLKQMGDPLDRPEKNPKFQGNQPIHMAVMTSNIPMLKKLLEVGISHEARNGHNHAPIHFCVQHGSVEGISILLAAGASPDVHDGDGDTPLMVIPQTQVSPECLRLLATHIIGRYDEAGFAQTIRMILFGQF